MSGSDTVAAYHGPHRPTPGHEDPTTSFLACEYTHPEHPKCTARGSRWRTDNRRAAPERKRVCAEHANEKKYPLPPLPKTRDLAAELDMVVLGRPAGDRLTISEVAHELGVMPAAVRRALPGTRLVIVAGALVPKAPPGPPLPSNLVKPERKKPGARTVDAEELERRLRTCLAERGRATTAELAEQVGAPRGRVAHTLREMGVPKKGYTWLDPATRAAKPKPASGRPPTKRPAPAPPEPDQVEAEPAQSAATGATPATAASVPSQVPDTAAAAPPAAPDRAPARALGADQVAAAEERAAVDPDTDTEETTVDVGELILAHLTEHGPSKAADIAAAKGLSRQAVAGGLGGLRKAKRVRKRPGGKWGLLGTAKPPAKNKTAKAAPPTPPAREGSNPRNEPGGAAKPSKRGRRRAPARARGETHAALLALLPTSGKGAQCAELASALDISKESVNYHTKRAEKEGTARREGKGSSTRWFRVPPAPAESTPEVVVPPLRRAPPDDEPASDDVPLEQEALPTLRRQVARARLQAHRERLVAAELNVLELRAAVQALEQEVRGGA